MGVVCYLDCKENDALECRMTDGVRGQVATEYVVCDKQDKSQAP